MPLRSTILYLSRQKALRSLMETSPIARRFSARFVAGRTLEEAIAACVQIHREGIAATLDYLGENVKSLDEAIACRDTYLRMLKAMQDAGIEPNVSLKLSQFGLDLSEAACEENVAALVQAAAAIGGFVRIDMESSEYTDRTISLVERLHKRYRACGTVIQAYLRRSAADIGTLDTEQIRVRLCKGAYLEKPPAAFASKAEVDANYLDLAQRLLQDGAYPALATHDEQIVAALERFVAGQGIACDRFEFQMLYGIRRDLQQRLIKDGYRLRLYIPFGEAWYPYFMRRLAERPANLLFFLRHAFGS